MENINLEEAKKYLRIDRDCMDSAIMEQPVLFYSVSNMLVLAKEEKDTVKMERDAVEAEIAQELRESFKDEKVKFTESSLRESVILDKDYEKAQNAYKSAIKEVTSWEYMKEAYSQRSFMLRELAHLWAANFYGENSLSGGNASSMTASSNRERMNRDRKDRIRKRKLKV